ncbi:MAG: tetratricopeptide repeat protein [Candidatus Eremiobacterota bacterium]
MTCSTCKTENENNYRYCFQCGMFLKTDEEPSENLLTDEEVNNLLRFSYVFEINNLVDQAIEACNAIAEVHPEWADVHFKLARAYEAKGAHGKAISEYKKAISINPDYIDACRCLGELYSDEGFYNEAIEQFTAVLNTKVKFDYADIHRHKGFALEKIGKEEQAIEEYKKALEINPDYSEANFDMAKIHYRKKSFKEAMEYISRAVKRSPGNKKLTDLEKEIKKKSA